MRRQVAVSREDPKKRQQQAEPQSEPNLVKKILAWFAHPDNLGFIQLALAFHSIVLSLSYYAFQSYFGIDPYTHIGKRPKKNDYRLRNI